MDRRQSDIACDVVAITQCPKEYFANQYGGKLSANTPEFDQFVDLIRVGMRRCLCRCNGIALGLDRLDHLKDKLQALQFALDFLLEPPWQLISSSSAQAFQPQHSLRVHGLVVVDAVDGAKSLDTVDVLAAFVDEASRSRCSRRSSSSATLGTRTTLHTFVPHAHAPSVTAAVARRRCDPSSLVVHVGRLAGSPDRLRDCALRDARASGVARSRHNRPHSMKSFPLTGQTRE